MCDRKPEARPFEIPASNTRRKLWELPEFCHCAVLGTCLTIRELEKVGRRGGIRIPSGASDYAIHGTFVSMVSDQPTVAKLIHKALDRKFKSSVDETKSLKTREDLAEFWADRMKAGAVPGAFWSVLTHPLTDERLTQVVYGDVHMLSHMVGASNRADIKKLKDLEKANKHLVAELEEAKSKNRQIAEQRNQVIAELRSELSEMPGLKGRIVALESQLAQYESETLVQDLTRTAEQLEDELSRMQEAHGEAVEKAEELLIANQSLASENNQLKEHLEATTREADHLEQLMNEKLASTEAIGSDRPLQDAGDSMNLAGTTVIYVGGRSSQIRHFRALVERANGCLLHHDGGLEGGDTRLQNMLARGDIVMCPLDCVSHSACNRAKTYCKRAGKCFVPLRSSGLSSFVSGLQDASKSN